MKQPAWMDDHKRRNTPQRQGIKTEQKMLKERGAVVHPMSGAGRIKHDGSAGDGDFSENSILYEIKDASKSFALNAKYLRQFFKTAVTNGQWPILLVRFPNFTVECRIIPDEGRIL